MRKRRPSSPRSSHCGNVRRNGCGSLVVKSLQDVALRTADALRGLRDQYRDETVVLVAHDSVNRIVLLQALDMPLSAYWRIEQEPCCINELFLGDDGVVKVLSLNDVAHLRGSI